MDSLSSIIYSIIVSSHKQLHYWYLYIQCQAHPVAHNYAPKKNTKLVCSLVTWTSESVMLGKFFKHSFYYKNNFFSFLETLKDLETWVHKPYDQDNNDVNYSTCLHDIHYLHSNGIKQFLLHYTAWTLFLCWISSTAREHKLLSVWHKNQNGR